MFEYKEKYKVACSECGQEWQISAKHDASKPIYCQECYWRKRQLGEF
jgi:CxxC-x17-CxxC domain-containing protein